MAASRRTVVLGLAGTVTAGAITAAPLFISVDNLKQKLRPTGQGQRGVPLATATADDWSLQKGSLFTLDTGHVVELIDVQRFPDHPGRPRNLRPAAFASTFEIKRGEPLAESRIFQLNHAEGGDFALLLTHASPEWPKRMIAVLN